MDSETTETSTGDENIYESNYTATKKKFSKSNINNKKKFEEYLKHESEKDESNSMIDFDEQLLDDVSTYSSFSQYSDCNKSDQTESDFK